MSRASIMIRAGLVFCFTFSVLAENWPYWRGPSRQGISRETGVPLQWSRESNIAWTTGIPGEAWSSPIVWGQRVYLTTTTESGVNCMVVCVNRHTGKIEWQKKVFEQVPLRKEGKNSYATPTPATDGKAVYAVFGDGSVVAVSAETGETIWENREVKFYSQHGLGASPVLYQDLLIMPYDGSSTGENKRVGWQLPWDKSFILAFNIKDGKVKWKATRGQSRIAHVTPNIMKIHGRDRLISGAGDVVQAFDLANGERLWSVYSQGEGVVPSIVIGEGLIFSASGFERSTIRVIRPPSTKEGEPEIAWEQTKGVPSMPSMLYVDGYLYAITSDGGLVSCYKAGSGEIIYQERVGGNHSASPVWADGKIYFTSEQAETTVIEAGPTFKILARNTLGEQCQASMAISERQIFLRTAQHLYCIGKE